MTPELAYFLKVNVAIILFYAFYRLFFYKDTFFHWRRTALLCFFAISLCYPLLNIQEWVKTQEPMTAMADLYSTLVIPEYTATPTQEVATNEVFSFTYIYLTGVSLLLLRFIIQLTSILRLRIRCRKTTLLGIPVHLLDKETNPFSFFNWIFIYPQSFPESELNEILTHELTHARQHHSADVIVSELMCIACWFNPFAWLMKREVRNNLEYIADNKVLESGHDSKAYQYHLLGLSHHKAAANLSNKFNVLPLKNRIKMMNKQKTKKIGKTKYIMFLPLAAMLMIISNIEAVARSTKEIAGEVLQKAVAQIMPALEANTLNTLLMEQQSTASTQQKKTVIYKGQVVEENGTPAKDAIITDLETNKSTKTDNEGNFSLEGGNKARIKVVFQKQDKISSKMIESKSGDSQKQKLRIVLNEGWNKVSFMDKSENASAEEPYTMVEEMPSFPGGATALMEYLTKNIKYPVHTQNRSAEGRVIIQFVIEKDGSINRTKVARSIDPILDKEAIRVVENMPKWIPGKQNGKEVPVLYTIPIVFKCSTSSLPKEEIKKDDISEIVVTSYGNKSEAESEETAMKVAEVMPKYPGGINALNQYIAQNIKYPTIAAKNKEEGTVVLTMTIGKDGNVSNIKVAKSVSSSLDAEAIRIISNMPQWEPGKQNGKLVAVEYAIPIRFRLQCGEQCTIKKN